MLVNRRKTVKQYISKSIYGFQDSNTFILQKNFVPSYLKHKMKRFFKIKLSYLFSTKTTLVLLLILLISLGAATLLEEKYDTITAKLLIYNAKWFELLMLLLVLNIIGNIQKYQLYRKEKIPGFLFHSAFIVLFIGGGISRYAGFDGSMHIRQGESSNVLSITDPHLYIQATEDTQNYSVEYPLSLNAITDNSFHVRIETKKKGPIDIVYNDYINNAVEIIDEKGKIKYVQGKGHDKGARVLIMDVTFKGKKQEVAVLGDPGYIHKYHSVELDGIELQIAFGLKKVELPFSIHLNKFILDKYPGSNIPSSVASEITLKDKRNGLSKDYRIFMNNVLDYDGYRIFQQSYDEDEKGTILSVSYDFYGTWITYFGYFIFLIGFTLTLFNKNSRYWNLIRKIGLLQSERKTNNQTQVEWKKISLIVISILLGYIGFEYLQNNNQKSAGIEHSEEFGRLIVQTYDGRFAPVNTLAYDVMHKISKKDKFNISGKEQMDAMQVFFDILVNEKFWVQQNIIYIRLKSVSDIIGVNGHYASLKDFFMYDNTYKLSKLVNIALRKNPEERNTFDNEILKVTERVEVFMMTLQGRMLNIFPEQGSLNNKWLNWIDSLAYIPLKGPMSIINEDLQLKSLNYNSILTLYLKEVSDASKSGDYSKAVKVLGYIESIQRNSTAAKLLPSTILVDAEIFYNEARIFNSLKNILGILSIILLLLAFIDNLKSKKSKLVSAILNFFIVLLGIAFAYHTFGMILRWYVSGHSPWSDGYEVLLLAAWSVMLAGFSFMRYSKIALAGTAFLAFLTLMTAAHSSFDPQLTNLIPVLKSEWLIVHVATLTIGYGFLGLGFILGLMHFVFNLLKNRKNNKRLNVIIDELTCINELTLTIGLFLVTIGIFFGAVWANETWGRYWKWDAKETWSLATIIAYSIVLHFRLVPFMKGKFAFNVGSVLCFPTVLITFLGVNYYFTKSIHSYTTANPPTFPLWGWIFSFLILALIVSAGIRRKFFSYTKP